MKLHDARIGEAVSIRGRPSTFSYYPTYQGLRREGVHSVLFSTDPWYLIRHELGKITDANAKIQALAFLAQAREFFTAANSSEVNAAKPLLLYYSFLNLAKCLIVRKSGSALSLIKHGISEKLPTTPGAIHGEVWADVTSNPSASAFARFAAVLNAPLPQPTPPSTSLKIRSEDFLAQILIGHRMFCRSDTNLKERFVSLESLDYMYDASNRTAWLRARAFADDFTRLGYPLTGLSKYLSNGRDWRNVNCNEILHGRRLIEAETMAVWGYNQRPSQVLKQISESVRSGIWRSVTSYPPYRKYYAYRKTSNQIIIEQLLSIYLCTFYFGSVTRYKPEQFEYILKSPIGPFILDFFSNQPAQFLYLMASEFVGQEVARAGIL